MTDITIPEGYRQDAAGRLVPEAMIPPHTQQRDQLIQDLVPAARALSNTIAAFKRRMQDDIAAHVALCAEQYGVQIGGEKGNVTLVSYDGRHMIKRARAAQVVAGEQILAAEALISELLDELTSGVDAKLKTLVDRAFRRNKQGELSVTRLLDLARVDIDDDRWRQAVQAIHDSLDERGSVTYYRMYERDTPDQPWRPIALDIAAAPVPES